MGLGISFSICVFNVIFGMWFSVEGYGVVVVRLCVVNFNELEFLVN